MNARFFIQLLAILIVPLTISGRDKWPCTITTKQGKITIYEPQPQSFVQNKLSSIAAISVQPTGKDPIFGAVWLDAIVETDRDKRTLTLEKISVPNIKFSGTTDTSKLAQLRQLLETELPKYRYDISLDHILAELDQTPGNHTDIYKNDPPNIIFKQTNSLLITFDGPPKVVADKTLNTDRVANTPFVIIKLPNDQHYYLYLGARWFAATQVTGNWELVKQPSATLNTLAKKLSANSKETPIPLDSIPVIVASTTPAELVQSSGKPGFSPITGTNLLYMSNSHDNIFMYISTQQYYVLLSGRWYSAHSLEGPWQYVTPASLPADFSHIPEGSPKDIVLASVPGTQAAREAVIDANVPQTAKADRKKTTTTVSYSGHPQFEAVAGTNLSYAVNTSSTVLKEGNTYFVVDKGVWFTGNNPNGPWSVATTRPADIDKVPPSSPVYNTKYVYIYDVTPTEVYVGYTPGYLGCYVAGPTVVYGTGYVYPAWFGGMYYPRPVTWGFGMSYNPWTGWSIGMGVNVGLFHFGVGYNFGTGMGFGGGWWGPPVYHPPFFYPYPHVYGPRPVVINNNYINVNNFNNRTNNIYNNRTDVITPNRRPPADGGRVINRNNLPGNRNISGETRQNINPQNRNLSGATQHVNNRNISGATRNPNLHVDRQGNVFQRRENGEWQQHSAQGWNSNLNQQQRQNMEQHFQARERGTQRTTNFQHNTPSRNFNRSGGFQRRR